MRARADALSLVALSLSRLPLKCYDSVVPASLHQLFSRLHYDAYALNGSTCSSYNPSCQMQLYPVCMLYLHVYGMYEIKEQRLLSAVEGVLIKPFHMSVVVICMKTVCALDDYLLSK